MLCRNYMIDEPTEYSEEHILSALYLYQINQIQFNIKRLASYTTGKSVTLALYAHSSV